MAEGTYIERDGTAAAPLSFGAHFQASMQFEAVFREGMALVESTARYLDGAGRAEAKALPPKIGALYATESMRLTTRLLDIASWLLIRRALKAGEISAEEAARKRQRVKLKAIGRASHAGDMAALPEGLRDLIDASYAMHDRIVTLDSAMTSGTARLPAGEVSACGAAARAANPVARQIDMLKSAFSG
ncbi:MAG: DUF1465 family protein [Hyphomicrobiaceae bacterium]|nr:DUF1465 family protein [Hyphomicrobiaceae bacterium]